MCYKPNINLGGLKNQSSIGNSSWESAVDRLEASLCPIRGFRCQNSSCRCTDICQQQGYEKITVLPGEEIILFDEKILPGTYCVPKGISVCNRASSTPIFSTSGWMCKSKIWWRGNYMLACKSSKAKDNSLNVLVDAQTGQPIEKEVSDYYETLPDGSRKYKCRCGSRDENGNAMLEILPFVCSSDYCMRDIKNVSSHFGWMDGRCHCGPFAHADVDDPTSPCLSMKTEVDEDNILVGRVNCMTKTSSEEYPIYCPKDNQGLPYITFRKLVGTFDHHSKYLSHHFDTFENLQNN